MQKHKDFPNLYVADHPLILHKLSLMRDVATDKALFKALLKEIALLMGYELTRPLPLTTREVETPLTTMEAPVLAGKKPVIVPVLRAGLGMAEGLEELMPAARVGHIGLYRDHVTHEPVEYLVRLPDTQGRIFILVDPMLATGNSAKHALDVLVREGAKPENIRFMALVAAPEGVKVLLDAYPQVKVYTAALDNHLNENAYIVPGLGDAGDRLFGTKAH
jgi:uracil phosphoribosyltransferase